MILLSCRCTFRVTSALVLSFVLLSSLSSCSCPLPWTGCNQCRFQKERVDLLLAPFSRLLLPLTRFSHFPLAFFSPSSVRRQIMLIQAIALSGEKPSEIFHATYSKFYCDFLGLTSVFSFTTVILINLNTTPSSHNHSWPRILA